ncbi:phage NinH family protein [Escherichia coli]
MTFSVKTIPDMLVEAYGNQTEVARRLKCSRGTVRKYVDDKDGKMHAIVNDVLMVHRGWSGEGGELPASPDRGSGRWQ